MAFKLTKRRIKPLEHTQKLNTETPEWPMESILKAPWVGRQNCENEKPISKYERR